MSATFIRDEILPIATNESYQIRTGSMMSKLFDKGQAIRGPFFLSFLLESLFGLQKLIIVVMCYLRLAYYIMVVQCFPKTKSRLHSSYERKSKQALAGCMDLLKYDFQLVNSQEVNALHHKLSDCCYKGIYFQSSYFSFTISHIGLLLRALSVSQPSQR